MTLTLDTLVKVLGPNGEPCHGGAGRWHLPKDGKPGRWMVKRKPALCESGYHVVTVRQLIPWLGPEMWHVEVRGKRVDDTEKSVVESARLLSRIETWNDRTARLFACDCAERSLRFFEAEFPQDGRPRAAIQAARDYANGLLDAKHLAAAWDAAGAAARAAAMAAAWAATRDAARAAARAAAWDAAWDAARDAARAAARDAARDAARAAAWDAAWDAARAAAWYAAWDAAREWQVVRLLEYLNGTAEQA